MEEVLTVRLPKGTRRQLERLAKARQLTVSQLVRKAIDVERLLLSLDDARASLIPVARRKGVFADEDVFKQIS
jgi:predicted transcriptional regulator